MRSRIRWVVTLCITLVMAGSGCMSVPPAPVGTTTLETADPDRGVLVGTYTWNGTLIHFEARRGGPNPPIMLALDPNAPRYAVDARVCDANSRCFLLQGGGHAMVDESWAESARFTDAPDPAESLKNNQAAWYMATDFSTTTTFQGLEDLRDALITLGRANPPEEWPTVDVAQGPDGVAVSSVVPMNSFTHQFEVWWAPLYGFEHSSTRTRALASNGVTLTAVSTCNHGSCAGTSGMARSCARSFSNRPSSIPIASNCSTTWGLGVPCAGDGCCGTGYGFGAGQHVCNDDSRLQRDMVVANALVCANYCGDSSLAGWAPSCW